MSSEAYVYTEKATEGQEPEGRHELQSTVDMIGSIISMQTELFLNFTSREHMPDGIVDAKGFDELYDERMTVAQAAIKIIRRMQDRLFKMSIDLDLDGDLMTFKEIKRKPEKNGQQMVNDDPETQASSES